MAENMSRYEKICCYYGVLLGFFYSVGNLLAYQKMKNNHEDGVPSVVDVVSRGKINIDSRINEWEKHLEESKRLLNKYSRLLGYPQIRESDFERIIRFCKSEPNRKALRNRAVKYHRYGMPCTIADIIQEYLDYKAKRKNKAGD